MIVTILAITVNTAKRVRHSIIMGLILAMSACATVSTLPESHSNVTGNESSGAEQSVIELSPDQQEEYQEEAQIDPNLPKLELDAKTLEQLLVLNLASYQGQWGKASKSALAVAESSQDYRVARIATLLALRNNDYLTGVQGAELWFELQQDEPSALNMLLISQVGSGQVSAALESLALHGEGKDIDRHIRQIAGLLVRQRNGNAAYEIVAHYVKQHPTSAQVMLSSAYVADRFQRFESAQPWLEQAMTLRPGWDLAAQMKIDMLRRQGKLDERATFIQDYIAQYPDSVPMSINYAVELARQERYQTALELMQDILVRSPRNVGALTYAAALAQQLDNTELARKYYRKALNEDPSNDEVRWSLGRLALIDKKYVTAERYFNNITAKESFFRAQLQVANSRFQIEGIESALATLQVLQPETESEYLDIALTRHYLLMQAHEYEDAFGYINETLIYLPDNADLLYARALVAAELKKVDVAEADFRAVIAQQPEHANALNALGYTLADQTERYSEAKAFISKALELRPNDAHILDSMGWVAYRLNDYETAITYLERAFAASPEVEIAAHLGEVLWESGQQEKARQVWRESYLGDTTNPVLNETLKRYSVSFDQ